MHLVYCHGKMIFFRGHADAVRGQNQNTGTGCSIFAGHLAYQNLPFPL